MKWEDVSKRLPGRSALSCRLHYQNFLERKPDWDEEKKNKLARLYERFKKEMWDPVAKELQMPWRAVEAMHWQLGTEGIAQRAGVPVFSMASSSSVPLQVPIASAMGVSSIPPTGQPPRTQPSPRSVPATMHHQQGFNTSPSGSTVQPYYTISDRQEWYFEPQQRAPQALHLTRDPNPPARQRRSASSSSQRRSHVSPARRRAGSASGLEAQRLSDEQVPPVPQINDRPPHISQSDRLPPLRLLTETSNHIHQDQRPRPDGPGTPDWQRHQRPDVNLSPLHPSERIRVSPQSSLGSGGGGDRDGGEMDWRQTRHPENRN